MIIRVPTIKIGKRVNNFKERSVLNGLKTLLFGQARWLSGFPRASPPAPLAIARSVRRSPVSPDRDSPITADTGGLTLPGAFANFSNWTRFKSGLLWRTAVSTAYGK